MRLTSLVGRARRKLRIGGGRRTRDLERRLAKARAQLAKVRDQRDTASSKLASAAAARDALREQVATLTAALEAERAGAALASGRDRSDLSYLFVVTYGRSGSTLLQGILSSIPGVVIRGENGGALAHLFAFHDTLRSHRERLRRPDPLPRSHPWWGIDGYPEATALRDMRVLMLNTVLRPAPDTRVVGFKEIDWPIDRLVNLLGFTRAVFPGARFVLNTRNLDDVAQSKWWVDRPDAAAQLQKMERAYVAAVSELGDAGYHVRYDDYVADPNTLRGLFAWLGEEFDEARVREVMAIQHSY